MGQVKDSSNKDPITLDPSLLVSPSAAAEIRSTTEPPVNVSFSSLTKAQANNSPQLLESSRKQNNTTSSISDSASFSEPLDSATNSDRSVSPIKRRRGPTATQLSAKPNNLGSLTGQLRNDRLGALVTNLCADLSSSANWETFVNRFRGPSYLSPDLDNIDHPAAALP